MTRSAPRLVVIVATWLVIFPEVLLTNALLTLVSSEWNVYFRTALLTAIVIPPAMLWFVPAVTRIYLRLRRATRAELGSSPLQSKSDSSFD